MKGRAERRTIVQIPPAQAAQIREWLDGAAKPLARVLDKLTPSEQEAFLKAMDLLETELTARTTSAESVTRYLAGFRYMSTTSRRPGPPNA